MSTIIVIESRPLIRRGIVQLISETAPGCQVDAAGLWDTPGEEHAANPADASQPTRTRYRLMLLSVELLEPTTHQTIAAAREIYNPESVLLLSEGLAPWPQDFPPYVVGCVPLHARPELLQASIRLALADDESAGVAPPPGQIPAPAEASLSQKKSGAALTSSPQAAAPDATPSLIDHKESKALGLTPRQYEVLVLLARGHTLKAIARHLNIAATTAKVHAETVYQRLHVHNRTEAIYAAISRGATLGWSHVARDMPTETDARVVPMNRSG